MLLSTDLWVSALIRRAELAGAFATVARKGDARAGSVSCRDPQLATVRARVDGAFSGWTRTPRMTFPGAVRPWVADRTAWTRPGWRLKQASTVGASPVAFGYAGKTETPALTAVVSFVGRSRPYAARIVLRDPARSPRAWPPPPSGWSGSIRARPSWWSSISATAASPRPGSKPAISPPVGPSWPWAPCKATPP